ncbi:MAG: D-cysteine desulfhydrase [Myxococcota bacterium]
MNIARVPRIRLAHLPTPLEPMRRLSEALGGPNLWIKRDDCTGLATGGNKTRKLEFLMAEAVAQSADTVVTVGAYQSNHVRQTAAAAAKLGLACEVVLEHRVPHPDSDYLRSGNRFLNDLFLATTHEVETGGQPKERMKEVGEACRARGAVPYLIPGGGSNTTGALGYALCAQELLYQAAELDLRIDGVVHATGSAGTQAGLVAGLEALNSHVPVLGISIQRKNDEQLPKVRTLVDAMADRLEVRGGIDDTRVQVNDNYIGPGYGYSSEAMVEAIRMCAELEGLLLDPVYSGKGMAGLIDLCRRGHFKKDENIVFIHTGGSVSLFAYLETFRRDGAPAES